MTEHTEGFRIGPTGARIPTCGRCAHPLRHGEEAGRIAGEAGVGPGFTLEGVRVCARCWAGRNETPGTDYAMDRGTFTKRIDATHQPKPRPGDSTPSPPGRGTSPPVIATVHYTVTVQFTVGIDPPDDINTNPSSLGVEGEEGALRGLRDWLDRLVLNEEGSAELWE